MLGNIGVGFVFCVRLLLTVLSNQLYGKVLTNASDVFLHLIYLCQAFIIKSEQVLHDYEWMLS